MKGNDDDADDDYDDDDEDNDDDDDDLDLDEDDDADDDDDDDDDDISCSSHPLTGSPLLAPPSTRVWRRCAARSSYGAMFGTKISSWTTSRSDAPDPRARSASARCASK